MNAKESRKREKTKNVWDKLKTKSKIVDLNPSTSIIKYKWLKVRDLKKL